MKDLLILDLDETLIYSSEQKLEFGDYIKIGEYFTYKRPFINEFSLNLNLVYDIGIWSSSSDEYAKDIVSMVLPKLFDPVFVYGRSKCTLSFNPYNHQMVYAKKLKKIKKLGYSLNRTLIVDDTPEKVKSNFGNAIYINEWSGDQTDTELLLLKKYLYKILEKENFRKVEKRFWKLEISENGV